MIARKCFNTITNNWSFNFFVMTQESKISCFHEVWSGQRDIDYDDDVFVWEVKKVGSVEPKILYMKNPFKF